MKRFYSMFLAIFVAVCFAFAYAESIDLESLTLDELSLLQKRVNAEITSRLEFSDSKIYPGVYVVGVDIKAGSYVITGGSEIEYSAVVATFENEDNLVNYTSWDSANNLKEYSKKAIYVYPDQESFIGLEDGDILYLGKGSYTIREDVASYRP